jgi:hypothetical protein
LHYKPKITLGRNSEYETDYFSDFFEGAEVLNGKLKKYKKYAFINKENTETNNVLFRGIKFNLYKVLEKK